MFFWINIVKRDARELGVLCEANSGVDLGFLDFRKGGPIWDLIAILVKTELPICVWDSMSFQ